MTLYTYYFFKENDMLVVDTYHAEVEDFILRKKMSFIGADMVEVFAYVKEEDGLMEEVSHTYVLR